jgi:hypothetical protein
MLIVAFAMLSVPRLPPAPERLSTTKVSPKTLPNVVARGRAKMSGVVPAGTGAITWTVRVGHLPWLLWPSADDASKTAGVVRIARRSTSCVPPCCRRRYSALWCLHLRQRKASIGRRRFLADYPKNSRGSDFTRLSRIACFISLTGFEVGFALQGICRSRLYCGLGWRRRISTRQSG